MLFISSCYKLGYILYIKLLGGGWVGVSDLILKLADKLQLPFQLSKKKVKTRANNIIYILILKFADNLLAIL